MQNIIEKLHGGLIVSCQAYEWEPLYGTDTMTKLAIAAEKGGASAIRVNGVDNIISIRKKVNVPIFGINKIIPENFDKKRDVIITPTVQSAKDIYNAGADIIAIDCTLRGKRTREDIENLYFEIRKECPVLLMGEVSNLEEGIMADEIGFDIISTTIAGYTYYTVETQGPDFKLIEDLVRFIDKPINAEGRFETPSDVKKALNLGAWTVTVGSAITRPQRITERFIEEIKK